MKKILIIVVAIILFFALMYSSFFAHELYHKWEMRDIEKTNESLCISLFKNCKNNWFGHYDFTPSTEESNQKALEIMNSGRGWEFRAYLFQTFFSLFISLIILLFIFSYKRKQNALKV